MKKYIMKVNKYIISQIAVNALLVLVLSCLPVIHKNVFDNIAQNSEFNIGIYVFQYVISLLGIAVLTYTESLITSKGKIEFRRLLSRDLFRSITSFSNKRFSEKSVPGYISIFNNDLSTIQNDYLSGILSIIKSVNMIIIYSLTIILFFDWRIAVLLSVISVLNITIFPRFTSKVLANQKYEELKKTELYTSKFADLLQGIKLFNNKTRRHLKIEHDSKLEKVADIEYRYGRTRTLAIIINGGSTYLINFVSIVLAAYLCIEDKITIGAAVASLGYIFSYISPMQMLMKAINDLHSSKGVRKKVENLLSKEESNVNRKKIKDLKTSIEIQNMNIYFDEFRIKDLSFNFEKGKNYALIGSTGCGKSTVLKSLAGLNELESGSIFIDGLNINKIDCSDIVTYLDQNEHIFADDFNDNITVYKSHSLMFIDKIKDAIDKEKYNTISRSKDCTKLSGGEKKLVSIIRKLVQDSSILLLDEPFTGVDKNLSKTALNELLGYKDKTIIMITHNIKDELKGFDEILLLKDGVIIGNGDYSMIKKMPEYKILLDTEIIELIS